MLHREILFAAESSANQFADHANFFVRQPEHLHDALTVVVNALTGGIDRKRAIFCWNCQRALRFQKRVFLARC